MSAAPSHTAACVCTAAQPSRLLDSRHQARGPHQTGAPRGPQHAPHKAPSLSPTTRRTAWVLSGDGGALHWRERARYHLGSTRGATLSTVTSREALLARRTRPPCRPRAGLMPRGGIWGYMLDTSSISWHLDPSDRVVITPYRIRNAVCVWSDSRAELATAVSQRGSGVLDQVKICSVKP